MPPAKERVTLVCLTCGDEFKELESQLSRGRGKFCSRACQVESQRKGSKATCAHCGATCYRSLAEQKRRTRQVFCSQECYKAHRTARLKPTTYPKRRARHIHREVAEAVLGRPLLPGEVVHHKDENKHHSDPSNLMVLPNQAMHVRAHRGRLTPEEIQRYSLPTGVL